MMPNRRDNTREGKAALKWPGAHNRKAGHARSMRQIRVRHTRRANKRRLNG